ncbi:PDC sensor domain-containing protein [Pedobacter aquatilis]|uniref:PDC sensor domain-containing protein n=1 Tax=Pedobacter aquatilis TaxID=351343 RepID=UPI00292D7C52|nr:PDC sensor domain-containing protein [Pedobacter aquatilis]
MNDNHAQTSRKALIITILSAVILISSLWVYKEIETNSLIRENNLKNKRLSARISAQVDSTLKQQLIVMSKPLVWAVRSKMIDKDMNRVNEYLSQLVEEQNFEEISIIDPKGRIIASTDEREMGNNYSTFYNKAFLNVNNPHINLFRGDHIILTTPIFGTNTKLGTLSFKYTLPKISTVQ